MMTKNEIYDHAKHLIALDKLEDALISLFKYFDNNQLLIQSARLSSLKSEINGGRISFQEAQLERNRIRVAVLSIAEECLAEYNSDTKDRINNKILYLKEVLDKKRNKFFAFVLFFTIFKPDIVKRLLLGMAVFVLTAIGISFYINSSTTVKQNNFGSETDEVIDNSLAVFQLQDSIKNLIATKDSLQIKIDSLVHLISSFDKPNEKTPPMPDNIKYIELINECKGLLSKIKSSRKTFLGRKDFEEIEFQLTQIIQKYSRK